MSDFDLYATLSLAYYLRIFYLSNYRLYTYLSIANEIIKNLATIKESISRALNLDMLPFSGSRCCIFFSKIRTLLIEIHFLLYELVHLTFELLHFEHIK